jgi:hypothetical protein
MISKDFFLQPIPIPLTLLKNTVNDDSTVTQESVNVLFLLRRETNRERGQYEMARMLAKESESEPRLARFANLLTNVPTGFEGFPDNDRPLKERALEYFAGEGFEALILAIMIHYDQATTPLAPYRSV